MALPIENAAASRYGAVEQDIAKCCDLTARLQREIVRHSDLPDIAKTAAELSRVASQLAQIADSDWGEADDPSPDQAAPGVTWGGVHGR